MIDRTTLTEKEYRDDRHLAARQALYAYQEPRHDLPGLAVAQLGGVRGPVVDVGCGNGVYGARLRAERPEVAVLSLDLSPGMLAPAVGRAAVADAQALPLADGSCGAVLAMHMLYHVPDIPRAIRELRRVLAPGGVALVSTNGGRDKAEIAEVWRRAAGEGRPSFSGRFTLEEAPALLGAAFAEVRVVELTGTITVREPGPVMAHMGSYETWADGRGGDAGEVLRHAERLVREEIAAKGAFEVTSRCGLLVCSG
ncbi:class I SAM-dependent methyltransferase [Streptomyces himastatinicus]|uniref:class I SAM-dependent methyltransferase n=1 Tax=Streptomyces himastatinicus TaxID=998084 RepID=UPI0001B511B3|nr:class I SAM-dependent methyltransferase [Streptomyces himastatinicus]